MDNDAMLHRARFEMADQSKKMLKAVINGETYECVADRFGISRTAVERRIKAVAVQLCKTVGVQGLTEERANSVRRLRLHRDPILKVLESFDPTQSRVTRQARILSREEIAQAVLRIKGRSSQPLRDIALIYLLFCTATRPLEIARLEIRDYLHADGSVRLESLLRPEVAITGKPRPLFFGSTKLNDALGLYLRERLARGQGVHAAETYRGLDPESRLFLSGTGEGFKITRNGTETQKRFVSRTLLETFGKLFEYAELNVPTRSARLTLVSRLYERGADEEQVGLILGIGERSAVRALLSRPKPSISALVEDLI